MTRDEFVLNGGNPTDKTDKYDAILKIDPSNAAAYAQSGRILYLTAGQAPDQAQQLVDEAKSRLDKAIDLDPTYVDARFFRAIVLANEYQDFPDAQSDLQRYLIAQPNGIYAAQARQLLADVTNAIIGTPVSPSTTTTPKSTTTTTKKQ